jgi:hypothetical protein
MFRVEVAMGGIQHILADDRFEFLGEISDAEPRALTDVAFVLGFLPEDHPEERGLAGTVRSDQSHP